MLKHCLKFYGDPLKWYLMVLRVLKMESVSQLNSYFFELALITSPAETVMIRRILHLLLDNATIYKCVIIKVEYNADDNKE